MEPATPQAAAPRREPSVELLERRAAGEAMMSAVPLADGVDVSRIDAGGVPALSLRPAECASARTILYFHGGGFRLGSAEMFQSFASHLASLSNSRVVSVDYRLAPENPFPAALSDARAAYAYVLSEVASPESIVVAGDSAGGGLAASLLLQLSKDERPLPAAGVLLSPWVDLRVTAESYERCADTDQMFSLEAARDAAGLYLDGHPATDPLASPVLGDWTGGVPLLVHVSQDEVLHDDGTQLAKVAQAAGVDVTYRAYAGVPHIWHVQYPGLPESVTAMNEVIAFIDSVSKPV